MQKLDLRLRGGLYTNPNNLSETPPGSLAVADNVVLDRESIIESRRGQTFYGAALSATNLNKLFTYNDTVLLNYDNKLAFDTNNTGTWTDFTGTYTAPTGFKIDSVQANRNLYFTSNAGIYKVDSIATNGIRFAGAPKGLDGEFTLTGSSGWLVDNNQVAYRIVYGYRDNQSNLVLGAPSQRLVVINPAATGTRNVALTWYLPSDVKENEFFQLYRSGLSGGDNIPPDDNMQLVFEGVVTATDITNKIITLTDVTPDFLRGAALYTNVQQEGILQANEKPPLAKVLANYKGYTFFGNTISRHRLNFTLLGVGNPNFGFNTQTGDTTNASAVVTNLANTTLLRVGMRVIGTGIPVNTYILSIDSATQITLTQNATATATGVSLEFQDRITVANTDYWAGSVVNIATNQFKVETTLTPAENIAETGLFLVEVINRSASNTLVYAYYVSGETEVPGKILIEERGIGGAEFNLSSTYGVGFSPNLPEKRPITAISVDNPTEITSTSHGLVNNEEIIIFNSDSTPSINGTYKVTVIDANTFSIPVNVTIVGTTGFYFKRSEYIVSDSETRQNRLFFSKFQQPEAVPLLNFIDIGSANDPIKKIVALRDSLYILKDDGIFRLTGENASNFTVTLFDNTATIKAPETCVAFNNQIFTFSDQGIIAIGDSGVSVISRPIENTLLKVSSVNFPNFESTSFAVAYESSRLYILFTLTNTTDTYPTQAFCYNSFTNSWTRWVMSRTSAIINPFNDKLYLTNPVNKTVYIERKEFNLNDYADEQYPVTISSSTGLDITLADATQAIVGRSIKQGVKTALITAKVGNVITVDRLQSWNTGSADVYEPILNLVTLNPNDAQNAGILKRFREMSFIFADASFTNIDVKFTTNFSKITESVTLTPQPENSWGDFPWGLAPWGGGVGGQQVLRTYIPLEKARANWLNVSVELKQAFSSFGLSGVSLQFNPMKERLK
jgi:hypothetical protein